MISNEAAGKTSMASAMGASVNISGPENGTYLVMGESSSLESIVISAGGQVVLRLNGRKILAVLPFTGYSALRGNRYISHIGPVTIDIERLNNLTKTLLENKNT